MEDVGDDNEGRPVGRDDPAQPAGPEFLTGGAARPRKWAAAKGRYKRNPEMTKNTATPISNRLVYRPNWLRPVNPDTKEVCTPMTVRAANARRPSKHGNRAATGWVVVGGSDETFPRRATPSALDAGSVTDWVPAGVGWRRGPGPVWLNR